MEETANAFTVALLLLAGTMGALYIYLTWLQNEARRDPADRSLPARAILGTWAAMRAAIEPPVRWIEWAATAPFYWTMRRGIRWAPRFRPDR